MANQVVWQPHAERLPCWAGPLDGREYRDCPKGYEMTWLAITPGRYVLSWVWKPVLRLDHA